MMGKKTYFKTGLVIFVAVLLVITGFIMVGSGAMLKDTLLFETYVDESVQGLDAGTAVMLRGVRVGEVWKIGFVQNDCDCHDRYLKIVMGLHPSQLGPQLARSAQDGFAKEIERGLRVRLATKGLTGGNYVEMDFFDPAQHPVLEIDWMPEHSYVPSVPSTVSTLINTARGVLSEVSKVEFSKTVDRLNTLVEKMTAVVEEVPETLRRFQGAAEELKTTVIEVRETIKGPIADDARAILGTMRKSARDDLAPALTNLREASERMPAAIEQMERTLRKMDRMMAGQQAGVQEAMENLRKLTAEIAAIGREAEINPSRLILGDPPPPILPKKGEEK